MSSQKYFFAKVEVPLRLEGLQNGVALRGAIENEKIHGCIFFMINVSSPLHATAIDLPFIYSGNNTHPRSSQFDPICPDLSGLWSGRCTEDGGGEHELKIKISQNYCDKITIDDFTYGIPSHYINGRQGGEPPYPTVSGAALWSSDRASLIFSESYSLTFPDESFTFAVNGVSKRMFTKDQSGDLLETSDVIFRQFEKRSPEEMGPVHLVFRCLYRKTQG